MLMGFVTTVLSALGCGPRSKIPGAADFDGVLHTQRALRLTAEGSGGFEIVAGDRLVLELNTTEGASRVAHDRGSRWTVVVELPAGADPAKPLDVSVVDVTAVARVAGEDVVYLARKATGTLSLAGGTKAVNGKLDVAFSEPERDLIKLGTYTVTGAFQATIR
jgi:hypothetical protein